MPSVAPLATLALRAAIWPWGSPATTSTTSLVPTTTAEQKPAWVTVNENGVAQTVTPVATTIDGAPTILSEIPYHLTGTIFVTTVHLEISTSTGLPVPTANKRGEGSFLECQKPDPDNKPFCLPARNASLYDGINYFVTWDPTYFNGTESKIKLKGFYDDDSKDEAFTSEPIEPGRGFYQWRFGRDMYNHRSVDGIPIHLQISLPLDETSTTMIPGPTVTARPKPKKAPHHPSDPSGKALWIGLPSFFAFLFLMVIGISFWNRKIRRISVGSVMSRSSRYIGKKKRFGKRGKKETQFDKEHAIPLMDRDSNEYPDRDRRNEDWSKQHTADGGTKNLNMPQL